MGNIIINTMKVLISLCVAVAAVSAAPRYLVIPIEDVDMSSLMGASIPVYRMPGLARQARQVLDEEQDNYQSAPYSQDRDSQASGSEAYGAPHSAPAHAGPDHVDYGAYTGGYGAFGWYTDHPVLSDLDTKCHHQLHHQCHHLQG